MNFIMFPFPTFCNLLVIEEFRKTQQFYPLFCVIFTICIIGIVELGISISIERIGPMYNNNLSYFLLKKMI